MEQYHHIIQTIALTMGVAWASGVNLYATLLVLGGLGATGHMTLPPDLQVLADPLVLGASGLMFMVEFFADKTPGIDTGWDGLHTFIRIPAGAILAAGAIGDVTPAVTIAAAILGGSMAAGAHMTKAGSRILINASPEPFSNWLASFSEDIAVIGGLFLALHHPGIFLILLLAGLLLMIWLLPKLWKGIRALFIRLAGVFRRTQPPTPIQ